MIGLSEVLRASWRREGIGVSAFCPGPGADEHPRDSAGHGPEQYRDSGYTELEQQLEERENSPLWMDPVECGERVLAGIRNDDLYIFTHREFREGAEERFQAMLASFPTSLATRSAPPRSASCSSNPIFREQLDRRSTGPGNTS